MADIPVPDPEPAIEGSADDEAKRYEQITDERLQGYIAHSFTISQICNAYKLTDSKYASRLYKRAEKFRSEDARRSNKKKAENSKPGTE